MYTAVEVGYYNIKKSDIPFELTLKFTLDGGGTIRFVHFIFVLETQLISVINALSLLLPAFASASVFSSA